MRGRQAHDRWSHSARSGSCRDSRRRPQLLRGQPQPPAAEQPLHDLRAGLDRADQFRGRPVEFEFGLRTAVDHLLSGHPHARVGGIDQEDRRRVGHAGRHQDSRRLFGERHDGLGSGQPPSVAVRCRGGGGPRRLPVPLLGQRHRQDRLARSGFRRRLALRVGPEGRQRARAEHDRPEVGHRRHMLAQLAEHRGLFQDAQVAAADGLRQRRRQYPGLAQRAPQRLVETHRRGVQFAQPVGGDELAAHLAGEPGQILLCFGIGEIHCDHSAFGQRAAAGCFRAVMAMMSRCTSLVPPPKVRIRQARCMRSSRPRSAAPGESWRR